MSQGTNLGSQKGRWIILAALVAVLGALLFLLPGGILQAQQTAETYYHQENDDNPVVTLSATDPEGVTPIYWDIFTTEDHIAAVAAGMMQDLPGGNVGVGGAAADDIEGPDVIDGGFFDVEDGVLSFEEPPDFEMGRANTYKVVVQASDGGDTEWVQYFKITVIVLDVEEEGSVSWTVDPDGTGTGTESLQDLLEFQTAATLAATVEDDDGPDPLTNATWKWYRSSSNTGPWTLIDGAGGAAPNGASYTVSDDANDNDVGMYLRAVASYTDNRGSNKEAENISDYPVRPAKVQNNSDPEFDPTSVAREVQEGSAGRNVGPPVVATDDDGDVLNYTLDTETVLFAIGQAKGQITVDASLNYEGIIDSNGSPLIGQAPNDPHPAGAWRLINNTDGTTSLNYVLEVRATDSAGANTDSGEGAVPDDLTVTITLLNVNEAPVFAAEDRGQTLPANAMGIVQKNEDGVEEPWDPMVSNYGVDDPEGIDVNEGKWSLSGDDAAKFQLTGTTANFRTLEFRGKADFENPGDLNGDNIYEVTVVASDGTNRAERSVTVKITDSDELGKITLSPENPVARSAVTATLTDSDGDVINAGWTWYSLTSADADDADTIQAALAGTTNVIVGETSYTYTPTSDDIGQHLVAVAVYMDRTEDEDNDDVIAAIDIRFDNRAQSNPSAPVTADLANKAPEFREGASAVRYVEENDAPGDLVARDPETIGAPLAIDDDDLPNDSHTFTLSGADAAYFDIESRAAGGQLMTKEPLNYESKKRYNLVVTVRDGSGESNDTDTINVTIQVKDLDEHPVITGDGNAQHDENDTGTVLMLVANDPERVTPIHWDFLETDPGLLDLPGGHPTDDVSLEDVAGHIYFDIENGMLTFDEEMDAPDFEFRADKTYRAVVKASDGGLTTWVQYFKVTVEVLDLEEEGEVDWTVNGDGNAEQIPAELLEFQPDALLTATVEDPDSGTAPVTSTTWQWSRSTSRTSGWTDIPNATGPTYTVSDLATDSDVNNYLRVEARYTDRRGANKEAEKISEHQVRPRKVNDNSVPEFAPTEHTRRVLENSDGGTNVGGAVTATDDDGDVLNYTLVNGTDFFAIDQAKGQITVDASLNYEGIIDSNGSPLIGQAPNDPHPAGAWRLINNTDGTTSLNYVLEVRATDSAGATTITRAGDQVDDTAHARVTITLLNVNEAPVFAAEDRGQTLPANVRGMAVDRHEETTATPDAFGDVQVAWNLVVSRYTATDPEKVVIDGNKWSLSGADAAKFELNDPSPASPGTKVLEFREPADFEAKADQNGDNIYEVTVVASDGSETAELDVTVKVLDSDEPGEIMFSPDANPASGRSITAALSDSDGDVINVAWQWYALDDVATEILPETLLGNEIKGEESDTYTPKGGDIGKLLVITAKYMDRTEDEDNMAANNTAAGFVRFANMVISAATAPVIDDPANAPPVFVEGATAVRYVEEDNLPGETAGRTPVEDISRELAVTDEDPNATHAFTLSGTDAGYFDIEVGTTGGGQLMTKARLDYETKDTYTVVVTANDGSGEANATANITVTIEVKDLDEKPEMFESGLVVSGSSSVAYMENGTDAVATYTAAGSMADMASLTLMVGDDARYFTLTNGVLTFKRSPDYEMPRGMAMSDTNTNTYMVTVKASDGTNTDMREVTVTVTDVGEIGRLSGPLTVSHMENSMDAVGTYMVVSGTMADTAVWTLDDDSHFELEGRGMSTMLKFKSAP